MPVLTSSYDKIDSYEFRSDAYRSLYSALAETKKKCTLLSEPAMTGYWSKVYTLNEGIRTLQNFLPEEYANGKTFESIANDIKALFTAIK